MTSRGAPKAKRAAARGKRTLRLHDMIARDLGAGIVSGRHKPGQILRGEIEASERLSVSRTAYREAIRILAAKGLVSSRPKAGTRVNAPEMWHWLDPDVLAWIFLGEPDDALVQALFELRRIVEPTAAELAAQRRTRPQLEAMRRALDGMLRDPIHTEAGQSADKAFHAALLEASGNPFIVSLTNSVTTAVATLTVYKQRAKPLERDPTPDHVRVYDAVAARNPAGAGKAMRELIRLAIADMPEQRRPKAKRVRPARGRD